MPIAWVEEKLGFFVGLCTEGWSYFNFQTNRDYGWEYQLLRLLEELKFSKVLNLNYPRILGYTFRWL